MKKIRVGFFYRMLPHYRLPIMEALSKEKDIDLTVLYSKEPPWYSLKTVDPDGMFPSEVIERKSWRFGKQEFLYHTDATRLIASGKFDVVILPANPRLLSNFPALRACKKHGIGVVWWSLGIMPKQSKVTLAIRRMLMKIPESIVLYTNDERDYFVSKGLPPEKVFVAQNTISVESERQAAMKWSDQRIAKFQVENGIQNKNLFLFCGQLREKKRVDWLLTAFAEVLKSDSDCHLCIIGSGESQEGLSLLSSELGIKRDVTFTGAIYDSIELAPWFISARALVVPRAIGLASFHGFAYGVPCITSADLRHQTPEANALVDNYNCLLYLDGDIGDLAKKMTLIACDGKLYKQLLGNACKTMNEKFTTQKMVDGFCQAIRYAKKCVSL